MQLYRHASSLANHPPGSAETKRCGSRLSGQRRFVPALPDQRHERLHKEEKQVNTSLRLSSLAVIAAMLVATPAFAISLNLGGGGNNGGSAVSVGGSNAGSGSTVSVDAGNLLGGTGGASGDNGKRINLGGTDTGSLLDLGGNGSGTDATVDVNLGGTGSNGTLVDLFGNGDQPTTANVNLGGQDGTNANVLLDLFGSGDNPDAKVTLGNGTDAVAGLGGTDGSVIVDLFGNGGTGTGAGGGDTSSGTDAFNDNGNTGGTGSSGGGLFGTSTGGTGGLKVASIDAKGGACFTPNGDQMAKLVGRHIYNATTFSSWAHLGQMKIIDVGVCANAAASIKADANVAALQAKLASSPAIRAGLSSKGHSPGDVIAADASGNTLVLYVM